MGWSEQCEEIKPQQEERKKRQYAELFLFSIQPPYVKSANNLNEEIPLTLSWFKDTESNLRQSQGARYFTAGNSLSGIKGVDGLTSPLMPTSAFAGKQTFKTINSNVRLILKADVQVKVMKGNFRLKADT